MQNGDHHDGTGCSAEALPILGLNSADRMFVLLDTRLQWEAERLAHVLERSIFLGFSNVQLNAAESFWGQPSKISGVEVELTDELLHCYFAPDDAG